MELEIDLKSDVKLEKAFKQENDDDEDEEEPMDTSSFPFNENEEGEIESSEDEDGAFRTGSFGKSNKLGENYSDRSFYVNDTGGFVTGINIFDKEESLKRLQRAERFGLPNKDASYALNRGELTYLHRSLGIDKENERHYRFNAIHMRGTNDMSTEDVFQYFSKYAPSHIEWINDVSCNVVWQDDISTARALASLSKEIKNLDKVHANADPFEKELKSNEIDSEILSENDAVDARDIKAAIPPGFWRIGDPSSKSSVLLLRYATRTDRKQRHAEQNSEYYKKYGNPHFGNIPGLVSKTLRVQKFGRGYKSRDSQGQSSFVSDSEGSGEELSGNKNPWGHLAHSWSKIEKLEQTEAQEFQIKKALKRPNLKRVEDLRVSLNDKKLQKKARYHKEDNFKIGGQDDESGSSSDGSVKWDKKIKVPRMKMYADTEVKKNTAIGRLQSRRETEFPRQQPPRVNPQSMDLRNKISRRKLIATRKRRDHRRDDNSYSESESEQNNDNDDSRDSGNWALEQYHDLRESLGQNKKFASKIVKVNNPVVEDSDEDDDDKNRYSNIDLNRRSPLQIEIENDGYRGHMSDSSE